VPVIREDVTCLGRAVTPTSYLFARTYFLHCVFSARTASILTTLIR